MSCFLSCTPSVFIINGEYEILINTKEFGITSVKIGESEYFEENSGVLSSEKNFFKIRIPQYSLDLHKEYTVVFRQSIDRKPYFSKMGDPLCEKFEFKPLNKTEDINIYHISDVHQHFDIAKNTASYFGDDLDLLIVNGDIAEVECEEDFLLCARFVGDISEGKIPVIFVRGNHDTRGRLAERFTDHFPSDGKNTYFSFNVGSLSGVALDCGEDKPDDHEEYGNTNLFEAYRRRETEFLKKTMLPEGTLGFAVCHIPPCLTTLKAGDEFDIERELYTEWCEELYRMGVKFMICGHLHKTFIIEPNSTVSTCPHKFPVIVGAAHFPGEDVHGAAITVKKDSLEVKFTDGKKSVCESFSIDLTKGKITKYE